MVIRADILLLSLIPGMMFMQVQDCCIEKPLTGQYASHHVATAMLAATLVACGGGGGSSPPAPMPPQPTAGPQSLASGPSPFAPNCNGAAQTGTLFMNAEVEPYVAVNPLNPSNLVGVW